MKIQWKDKYSTGQIYSSGPEFALLSPDRKQIGPFVYCADFLSDAIRAYLHKTSSEIYDYKYTYGEDPTISFDATQLLYVNAEDEDFDRSLFMMSEFLYDIEKDLGYSVTTGTQLEQGGGYDSPPGYKDYALFEGPQDWMLSPAALSLYRLIIRNGAHYKGQGWRHYINEIIAGTIPAGQENDAEYWRVALVGLDHIIESGGLAAVFGVDVYANYPKDIPISRLHHDTGIVSFSESHPTCKKWFPHWDFPKVKITANSVAHS